MRFPIHWLLFTCLAISARAETPDWAAFLDPKSIVAEAPMLKAIETLATAEKAAAMQRLRGALSSEELEIRRRAAFVLGKFGDMSGVPVMIRDMATKNDNDRGNIAVILRILKDPRAIPVLRANLRDQQPYVRGIALSALGEMKATEALADIAAHLSDHEREAKTCIPLLPSGSAAYALGALGDRKATPMLIRALDDAEVAFSATQALTALTGERFGNDAGEWRKWWKATEGR